MDKTPEQKTITLSNEEAAVALQNHVFDSLEEGYEKFVKTGLIENEIHLISGVLSVVCDSLKIITTPEATKNFLEDLITRLDSAETKKYH